MTLQECYAAFGGDYNDVSRRLGDDAMIERFLRRVPEDPTYTELLAAMEEHRDEDAFRAAHTMKGFCLTLGIKKLGESTSVLTEQLRNGRMPEADGQLEKMKEDFILTSEMIGKL
ncbi:MAG: Hpt domain-containing protein [Lachnospiraceae bacterium]|nr:Hpt domain-containing protein [Lachnospiraceae bacterium]